MKEIPKSAEIMRYKRHPLSSLTRLLTRQIKLLARFTNRQKKQTKKHIVIFQQEVTRHSASYRMQLTQKLHTTLSKLLHIRTSLYQNIRSALIRLRQTAASLQSYRQALLAKITRGITSRTKKSKKIKKKYTRTSSPLTAFVKLKYFSFGVAFSFIFLFVPLAVGIFLLDLPNPQSLSLRQIPQTSKIYDRHGKLLYQIYANQNRTLITLADVPKHMQQATLAIEDKNFYDHPGFDITSIIRAVRENVSGRSFQGGSTITQQLIKSSMLTPEKSFVRKTKEIVLAFWAERIYTKDQILEMYFNQVPYGGTAWGVEAAAEVYFGKKIQDITLAESAFLAGITAAPSSYSPYGPDQTLWKKRQREVLKRMVALGYISKRQAADAEKRTLAFQSPQVAIHAPHFVEYVKNQLIQRYGLAMVERGGLSVRTTLDLKAQEMAEKVVAEEVANAAYLNLTNGAAVVTDPKTGDILAMVGSKDFSDPNGGKVNLATSHRQPGSSIKPVTYAAAMQNGFTAATVMDDSPITYTFANSSPYAPVNYDGRFLGKMSLRMALANSRNTTAVKTLHHIGIPSMVTLAKQMGIRSWSDTSQYGLSITLGGAEVTMLDMATVYGTFANLGRRVDLDPVLKITDGKGAILQEKRDNPGRRVLDSGIAFIISDILADNQARTVEFGANSPLLIPGHTVSVKTGTTDYKRDNWTVGYTNKYVVTVWVGNNDNTPMSQALASGITGAAPIWHRIMAQLLEQNKEQPYPLPANVISLSCLGRNEYFVKGTEQTTLCRTPRPTIFLAR
jgi:1A family penicillin-binding protein